MSSLQDWLIERWRRIKLEFNIEVRDGAAGGGMCLHTRTRVQHSCVQVHRCHAGLSWHPFAIWCVSWLLWRYFQLMAA